MCVNAHLAIFLNLPSYGIWCVILRHSHTICPLRCCSPILSLSLENKGNFSEEILLRKREFGALSLPAAAASPVCGSDIMSRPDLFSISVATKWSGKGRTHFYTSTSLLLPLFSQARKIFSSFCRAYCIRHQDLIVPRYAKTKIYKYRSICHFRNHFTLDFQRGRDDASANEER